MSVSQSSVFCVVLLSLLFWSMYCLFSDYPFDIIQTFPICAHSISMRLASEHAGPIHHMLVLSNVLTELQLYDANCFFIQ